MLKAQNRPDNSHKRNIFTYQNYMYGQNGFFNHAKGPKKIEPINKLKKMQDIGRFREAVFHFLKIEPMFAHF